jgi:hypothetical protein
MFLEAMKAGTANPVPFSLASDASNKGNHKHFFQLPLNTLI